MLVTSVESQYQVTFETIFSISSKRGPSLKIDYISLDSRSSHVTWAPPHPLSAVHLSGCKDMWQKFRSQSPTPTPPNPPGMVQVMLPRQVATELFYPLPSLPPPQQARSFLRNGWLAIRGREGSSGITLAFWVMGHRTTVSSAELWERKWITVQSDRFSTANTDARYLSNQTITNGHPVGARMPDKRRSQDDHKK